MSEYRICSTCIMDTSDPDITFNHEGVCNHCDKYRASIASPKYLRRVQPGALDALVARVKASGRGRRYDCVIGVSGGVDSTYVAYRVLELGLRPLAVHLDNGWDSEVAVENIQKTLERLGIDLYTHVIDWSEFRQLQLAFLKASTPDLEIPTDHAILASLYQAASREGVRYVLSGHNTATEGGGVAAWAQGHGDWRYIQQVSRRFGGRRMTSYPHYGVFRFLYYTLLKGVQWVQILDYVDYRKDAALQVLRDHLGWRDYGGKHYESIFTRFYMGYYLPTKFGYEFKRLHIASMVWSGQLTREAAMRQMQEVDYPVEKQQEDVDYVIKKLGISQAEFEGLMRLPKRTFSDYPSYKRVFSRFRPVISVYHALKRK